MVDENRLTAIDFDKLKIAETIAARGDKPCRLVHNPLWQADPDKIQRMVPTEFIGRFMPGWFDYAICDEIHQLAGAAAQGNAFGYARGLYESNRGTDRHVARRLCRRPVQHFSFASKRER